MADFFDMLGEKEKHLSKKEKEHLVGLKNTSIVDLGENDMEKLQKLNEEIKKRNPEIILYVRENFNEEDSPGTVGALVKGCLSNTICLPEGDYPFFCYKEDKNGKGKLSKSIKDHMPTDKCEIYVEDHYDTVSKEVIKDLLNKGYKKIIFRYRLYGESEYSIYEIEDISDYLNRDNGILFSAIVSVLLIFLLFFVGKRMSKF